MDSSSSNLLSEVMFCMNKFLKQNGIPEVDFECSTAMSAETVQNTKQLVSDLNALLASQESEEEKQREKQKLDPLVVQITASKEQLSKRISAFMLHAQNAVNEQNVKEFCHAESPASGCARTDARYKPRASHSSHMQVKKAANAEGPQLQITSQGMWKSTMRTGAPHRLVPQTLPQPINERLVNLESHLNSNDGPSRSSDIYARLKNLEDRLLLIEGTSPEYLARDPRSKAEQPASSNAGQGDPGNFTLQEIDDRIRHLKHELQSKKRKLDEGMSLVT